MNSKQRVQAVLDHKQPDRVPLGFFAIDSDTASKVLGRETYWRAKAKCTMAFWEGRRDEVVQSWIEDGIELYKKLDIIDIVPVCVMAAGLCPPKNYCPQAPRQIDGNTWEDKQGRIYKHSSKTKDITVVHDPACWSQRYNVEDELWDGKIEKPDASIFEAVNAIIEAFKKDRFIIGNHAGEMAWLLLGGMERGFMEIASRPQEIKQIFDSQVEKVIAHDEFYINQYQDAVMGGEDLTCSTGPLINPDTYRDLFLPGFKKRLAVLKTKKLPFIKHCCGDTTKYLEIFKELDIDCYQAIQASAGVDILEVQKKYKDSFALWGGVPVEHLIESTTEQIRQDVKHVMTKAAPEGSFILGTTHSIAVGTKYDNFMALLDEFSKWI